MLDTIPGLRIDVMSSSTSVMSAMIAKIPVSEPALPSPISAASARIGTSDTPGCENANSPRTPISLTGAAMTIAIFFDVFLITGPKMSMPISCAIISTARIGR